EAAWLRSAAHQGYVREADRQPLRKQLWRSRQAAQPHHRAAGGPRLQHCAQLSDEWAQARGAHRDQLDDPARAILRWMGDESVPGKELSSAFARDFGSFDRWRAEFTSMGKALAGGSGWVLLSYSPRDGKLVNQWAADHCHTLAGGRPLLALD